MTTLPIDATKLQKFGLCTLIMTGRVPGKVSQNG